MNKSLEKQKSQQNLPSVPGKRNYCEATQPRPSHYNTLIYIYDFNSLLRNGKAQILNFLGSSSKQM